MRSIRGGSGLGDALYVQSVARHFVLKGEPLEVCAEEKYHDVFRPLGDMVMVAPHRRLSVDILAHYTRRREHKTDQFVDCCIEAGIGPDVEMRLDWTIQDQRFVDGVRQGVRRPLIAVQMPRIPMDRKDGFGAALLPDLNAMQRLVDLVGERATLVQIGAGNAVRTLSGIDIDLANQTTVAQMLDVASICDGFLGYCSFMVPLAESLSRPALFLWSSRGLRAGGWAGFITPQKILHAASSLSVVDSDPGAFERAADAFLGQVADSAVLRRQVGGDRRERAGVAA